MPLAASSAPLAITAGPSSLPAPPPPSSNPSAPAPPPPSIGVVVKKDERGPLGDVYQQDGDWMKDIEINNLRNRYLLTKGATQQQVNIPFPRIIIRMEFLRLQIHFPFGWIAFVRMCDLLTPSCYVRADDRSNKLLAQVLTPDHSLQYLFLIFPNFFHNPNSFSPKPFLPPPQPLISPSFIQSSSIILPLHP